MNPLDLPAYQGRGWKTRTLSLDQELNQPGQKIWGSRRSNSEWAQLKTILIYEPGAEVFELKAPRRAQQLRALDRRQTKIEYDAIRGAFSGLGIEVLELEPEQKPPPNLMFARDLFFNTPAGCVVARMASQIRAGEERFAAARLAREGVPIAATIGADGLFEGADALWLTPQLVLCGVGARTNHAGLSQLRAVLKAQNIKCLAVRMPTGVQHLLGLLQIVAKDLAVVRTQKAPPALTRLLHEHGLRVIGVDETDEVTERQAMNFVTVAERHVVMAADCPNLRALLRRNKIRVGAEVPVTQLVNAAGGLACATGILARKILR